MIDLLTRHEIIEVAYPRPLRIVYFYDLVMSPYKMFHKI